MFVTAISVVRRWLNISVRILSKKPAISSLSTQKPLPTRRKARPFIRDKAYLDRLGIDCSAHVAAKLSKKDCDEADYIIGMENYNLDGIKRIAGEKNYGKIYKLLDFSSRPRDIPDPWYTHDFEATFKDVLEGISGFISYLEKRSEV